MLFEICTDHETICTVELDSAPPIGAIINISGEGNYLTYVLLVSSVSYDLVDTIDPAIVKLAKVHCEVLEYYAGHDSPDIF